MSVGIFIASLLGLGVLMAVGIIIGASAVLEFQTATMPGRWPRMVFGVILSLILVLVSGGVVYAVFEARHQEAISVRLPRN
ncbi:MAG: hypothetical protein ACKVYV_15120 [Limisphaerales bacterium]